MKILGIRRVVFQSKKTGEQVRGAELSISYPFEGKSERFGEEVDKLWLSDSVFQTLLSVCSGDLSIMIGKGCELSYNKYGRISDVRLTPSK